VEEFLEGLSSDDLDALEKYVVDDVVNDRVAERSPEPEEYETAVRTVPDGDDDVGKFVLAVQTTART